MTLEQQLLDAISAQNQLTQTVSNKITQIDQSLLTIVPPGSVIYFARDTAPEGWLKCDGAVVARASYSALFAAIGITFGAGNGATTFTLPDLRGEFVRGWDDGRGVDAGRGLGSSQISTQILVDDDAANVVGVIDWTTNNLPSLGYEAAQASGVTPHYTTVMGNMPFSNAYLRSIRPRNIALLACIKY